MTLAFAFESDDRPEDLHRVSQGQLSVLDTCPRKYQYLFLDGLSIPPSSEQQASLAWGQRFHLLMQQRELGIPINAMIAADPDLGKALYALQQAAPDLLDRDRTPTHNITRASEHRITVVYGGFWLTGVYDLLLMGPERAEIVDWKTHQKPVARERLEAHWQTQLYLWMLGETGQHSPQSLSMTYWFVRTPSPQTGAITPQAVRIPYSRDRHQTVTDRLRDELSQLELWLQDYARGRSLPQLPEGSTECDRCPFATRCDRGAIHNPALASPMHPSPPDPRLRDALGLDAIDRDDAPSLDRLTDIDAIAEIPIDDP
jgi:hypothetical protein